MPRIKLSYIRSEFRPLRGSRSPAKGAGRRRRGRGTGWWPHLAPVGDEEAARRRGVVAVAGARRHRDWTAEERRWGGGMAAVEYCEVRGPFYRAREVGRWPAGSDGGGGAFSSGGRLRRRGEEEVAPIEGGERRRRPRGIRSRAEEVARGHGGHVGVRSRGSDGCSCSGKKKAKAAFGSLRFLKRET
jgi:hypothetical protein